ncbi:MAG: TetR/AcrR family transcriptional regulator [Microthrixaceae bacterium]|nr:TetR/AcrR family transcriptional regulator [Microthrixaceae bacterium]
MTDPEPSELPEMRAADGRVPGRRGLATRARILDTTRVLISTRSYRDLKVVDIAREVGSSPATFYQYFADVEAAVLALADELVSEGPARLVEPLTSADWHGRNALDACEAVAEAFLSFWADHSGLMAVIDLAVLEGDERFRERRTGLLNKFTVAATDVIEKQKQAGFAPDHLDPWASAVVLVSMLSHVAAHQRGITDSGVSRDELKRSMARVIYASIIGRTPLDL